MDAPRNVLVIMSDEHNPKYLGAAGHPYVLTPSLDALAARGTRFTSAYTTCPICVPARAAFAAGRYVHEIGFWDNGYQKHLARIAPERPAEEEDEYDYDEDGELVKIEKPVPRFPVPPLDLPHYHGLELDTATADAGAITGSSVRGTSNHGDAAGATKEVTGA